MVITQPNSHEHMPLISHLYTDVYKQIIPQQGETKRRRRKKMKEESGMRKRKLSDEQVKLLEVNFGSEHKLESERKDQLAAELGLDPRQVAVWFQNRRARWKNKMLQEEYSNLKSLYDNVVLDKCRLQSEVVNLKKQLSEAAKEIQRLTAAEHAGNSPTSSYSVDVDQRPLIVGEQFGMEGYNDVLYYMPVENCANYGGDQWINLYD